MIQINRTRLLNWTPVDKTKVRGEYKGLFWSTRDNGESIHIDSFGHGWHRKRAMAYLGFISRSPEWDAQIIIEANYYETANGMKRKE